MKRALPKLPKGMGGYSYVKDTERIKFKKVIEGHELAVYGYTISEVNQKMRDKEDEYRKNKKKAVTIAKTKTLETGMYEWMQVYKKSKVTAKSYDREESTYMAHVKGSNLGRMQERSITSDDIQVFMNNLKPARGNTLGYSSKKKIYELLCQYFRHLHDDDPTSNPMRKVTKPIKDNTIIREEELIIWDDDEMDMLTNLAYDEYVCGVSGYKYGLLVTFLMWSYLRLGELLALQWRDINFKTGEINIYKQISKVKNREEGESGYIERIVVPKKYSQRKFKLVTPALNALKTYKKRTIFDSDSDYICSGEDGKRFGEQRIQQCYKCMRSELGLEKNVTVHGLRHTGISYLIRHGVPIEVVSKTAGHKDISTTINIYYSVLQSQKNNEIDKLNESFK